MLRAIELRDFAIADDVTVPLGPGLNVVTGETGAGKSLVIDALALATGGRADVGVVRDGAAAALVQLHFDDAAPLGSAGRRIVPEGRNVARLDGEVVTVTELQAALDRHVGIFGQHAHRTLLDGAQQRALLDAALDHDGRRALEDYRAAYERTVALEAEIAALRSDDQDRERRLEVLRHDLAELEGAALRAGEHDDLEERLATLRHAERVRAAVGRALDALREREGAAGASLVEARRALQAVGAHARQLDTLAQELEAALTAVDAVASELEAFLETIDEGGGALERLESRAAQLEALFRKHGGDEAGALAALASTRAAVERLDRVAVDLQAREVELAARRAERDEAGGRLSRARTVAATRLQEGVDSTLRELGLPGAAFTVALRPRDPPGPHGLERVAFRLRANPGEGDAALDAVASGGELSRVMLALNAVAGSDRAVLAFDEVDAGLGGRAGRAVAEVLKRLSHGRQVLVVTHLAQVAATADRHLLVEKALEGGRTVARVRVLEGDDRVHEVARMLSGDHGASALRHARELLAAAAPAS